MAKREKDKVYFEITKEKPYDLFQMLMVGGGAGSVLGFLIVSLVGAYVGMEMDSLVLSFLVASFLGFFFGAFLTWLGVHFFDGLLSKSPLMGSGSLAPGAPEASVEPTESPVVANDEEKGKSVDFIFPEFSPDNQ